VKTERKTRAFRYQVTERLRTVNRGGVCVGWQMEVGGIEPPSRDVYKKLYREVAETFRFPKGRWKAKGHRVVRYI